MSIPYGRQSINQQDIDAVVDVLKSDFLTQGPKVPEFEVKMAVYCGAEYGVAVNSATSALHIACLALGLGKDDFLWTSPNTFVASANVGLLCGAQVDFVDIDSSTYNMCPIELENKLKQAESKGVLPKIVMPVHFAGQSCDMQAIYRLSKQYGFAIIEDASHAVGASYLDQKIGNCRYSDITVFSFHPVKIITTAEGGLATTNNKDIAERMRLLRAHGVRKKQSDNNHSFNGDWFYEQITLGMNYRMSDVQATLGISQLSRVDEFVNKRQELASNYFKELSTCPITLPEQFKGTYSSFHLFPIQLKNSIVRKSVFEHMRKKGIGVQVHYIPVHRQPFYNNLGFNKGDFPNSENYYEKVLSLPIYKALNDSDQSFVIDTLKECLSAE